MTVTPWGTACSAGLLADSSSLSAAFIAWLISLMFLWGWWNRTRFARLLRDVPCTPIRGVFVGLVETSGVVEHDEPLIATLSKTPCVYYQWSVSESWRRTETYKDSKGKTQTRTVTGSDVVASGGEYSDLRLRDETGAIIVRVDGASWTAHTTFRKSATRGDALYHTQAPNRVVRGSTGQRRFSESAVPVGSTAWIMGNARIRPDGDALEIASGGEEGVFLISLDGERSHSVGARIVAGVCMFLGLVTAASAGGALNQELASLAPSLPRESALWISAGIHAALFLFVMFVMWVFIVRNGAVRVRTRWERAASLVDVELKRRADLIPNLVAVTRGSAAHEAIVQRAVAELRAGAASDRILTMLCERYPQLQTDGAFLGLQRQLTETESRIAQSRMFEIQSRERLIERLSTFPEGTIALFMGVSQPPPALASPAAKPSSPVNRPPS